MRQRSPRRFPVPLAALGVLAVLPGLAGCAGRPEPQPEPTGEWTASPPVRTAATLPSGFEDRLVATLPAPTALAFLPDGAMLITSQRGQVRIHRNGALLQSPALDLSGRICTNSERGVLGVAVDPAHAVNGYLYLYYTFNKSGACPGRTASAPVNRVSRFTLGPGNTVNPASEVVLVDNIPSWAGNHNAGDLHFGRDGHLYVTVGDSGCDPAEDSGCAGDNDVARDESTLLGKVLRITRDGGIPADNPFRGADSARCNTSGRTSPGKRCQETFAWGLRNPFRFAFDPNAQETRFFINDVGQSVWEEINLGAAGADYGWNRREGHCGNGSTTSCPPPPAGTTNPVFDYKHGPNPAPSPFQGCNSITGGAFVPNGFWPPEYDGSYLFSDYVCGKVFKLAPAAGGGYTATAFATGLGGSSAVHLAFGPHGSGRALYYTTYANGGEVRRIAYTGSGNRAPIARASATTPPYGGLPLSVSFSAAGSSDPDGDALTYEWDFGDGSARAAGASASRSYPAAGTFLATLTVKDSRGAASTATVRVDPGNSPPSVSIASPAEGDLFRVGQTVALRGAATDPEDGAVPDARLSWTVILHHDTHTHPFLGPSAGNGLSFTGPAPEDLLAAGNSYLEIRLTATDARGLSRTVVRNFNAKKVDLTFATQPAGLGLTVNGVSLVAPRTVTSWEGYRLDLNAPAQSYNGQSASFASWSDGGAAAHAITTPAGPATYTATYAVGGASQTVASLSLVNADGGQPILGLEALQSGTVLNLAALPTRRLSVRANTAPATVGSVRFGYDGNPNARTESYPPYALSGDTGAGYNPWTPSTGEHTLTATPYAGYAGGGAAGPPLTVAFGVVDGPTGAGGGLRGEYHDNADFSGPKVTRTDPTVSFDWGAGSPAPGIGPDSFAVRWTGKIEPAHSETYTFFTTSDDGVRLWVNGQKLVDSWKTQAATVNSGTLRLAAGQRYPVVMEYYDGGSLAVARLEWSSPSQPRQVVPSARLYGP